MSGPDITRLGAWFDGSRAIRSERLQAAALELFAERGYEQTTAAEIAQSVGLTQRTFFRHFSDKREVLFHGQQLLVEAFLGELAGARPTDAPPMELVASALGSAEEFFPDERRDHSRLRQSVIDQNPALQERERHKLPSVLATTLGDALRARGIAEPAATLTARIGRDGVRRRLHAVDRAPARSARSGRSTGGGARRTAHLDRPGDGVTQDRVTTPRRSA